jgi:hypothetical protein
MRPEGLGNLIKIIHLIGSRTRDLPAIQVSLLNSEKLHLSSVFALQTGRALSSRCLQFVLPTAPVRSALYALQFRLMLKQVHVRSLSWQSIRSVRRSQLCAQRKE